MACALTPPTAAELIGGEGDSGEVWDVEDAARRSYRTLLAGNQFITRFTSANIGAPGSV